MSFDPAHFPPAAAAGGAPPSVASDASGPVRVNDSRGVSCSGFVLQVLRADDGQPMSTAVVNGVDQLVAQKDTDAKIKVSNPFVEKNEEKRYLVSLTIDGTYVGNRILTAGVSVLFSGYSVGDSKVRPFRFTHSAAMEDDKPATRKGKKGKRRGGARQHEEQLKDTDPSLGLIEVRIEEWKQAGLAEASGEAAPVRPRSEQLEQSRVETGTVTVQARDKKLPILASGGALKDSGRVTIFTGTKGQLLAEIQLRYNALGEEISKANIKVEDDDDDDGEEDDTEKASAAHKNKKSKTKKEDGHGDDDNDEITSHAGFTHDSLSQQQQ